MKSCFNVFSNLIMYNKEDPYTLDNLNPKINESLRPGVTNSEFKINRANEIQDILGEGERGLCEREKMSTYIGTYVNIPEF